MPTSELSLIAFPTRELFLEKIDDFDLIIFDRYKRRGILPSLYLSNVAQYVKDGGAVLVAAGPDFASADSIYRSPLAEIMPAAPSARVMEQGFQPTVSELGNRHPVTAGLPDAANWGRWMRQIEVEPSAGDVLMTGFDEKPLLILNRVGEGRVAMLLSDHVWLWARGFEGGGPHVPLLRRLGHWLMQEPDLEEEALRLSLRGPELVVERQTLADEIGEVTLSSPSGRTTSLTMNEAEPGLWRGSVPTSETGLFTVTESDKTALIHVGPQNPREYTDVLSTTEKLAGLSAATGGQSLRLADVGGDITVPRIVPLHRAAQYAGNGWIGLKTTDASILNGVDSYPLLMGLLGLALLVGFLSMTWYREGR